MKGTAIPGFLETAIPALPKEEISCLQNAHSGLASVVDWHLPTAKIPPSCSFTWWEQKIGGTGMRKLTGQDKDRRIVRQLLLQAKQT